MGKDATLFLKRETPDEMMEKKDHFGRQILDSKSRRSSQQEVEGSEQDKENVFDFSEVKYSQI